MPETGSRSGVKVGVRVSVRVSARVRVRVRIRVRVRVRLVGNGTNGGLMPPVGCTPLRIAVAKAPGGLSRTEDH